MDKIPKRIHYCWFGETELSELGKKCIKTWEKYCPEYEIVLWNEKNFDIDHNLYVKQAFELKKWAFVSDYVRLKVLYEHGGVYMDTDVEMIKKIDDFLNFGAFSGFESDRNIPTGIIGARKNHPWIRYLLSYYENRRFLDDRGRGDFTTNVAIITEMTKRRYCIELNNKKQIFGEDIALYPYDYFCAKNQITGKVEIGSETYTVHHFAGSWLSSGDKMRNYIKVMVSKVFGEEVVKSLIKINNIVKNRNLRK